jgi:hypothetical protein
LAWSVEDIIERGEAFGFNEGDCGTERGVLLLPVRKLPFAFEPFFPVGSVLTSTDLSFVSIKGNEL